MPGRQAFARVEQRDLPIEILGPHVGLDEMHDPLARVRVEQDRRAVRGERTPVVGARLLQQPRCIRRDRIDAAPEVHQN
jgi:hypothetical protein